LRLCRDKTSTMYLSIAARTACIFSSIPGQGHLFTITTFA
jgi:hypothetical protein